MEASSSHEQLDSRSELPHCQNEFPAGVGFRAEALPVFSMECVEERVISANEFVSVYVDMQAVNGEPLFKVSRSPWGGSTEDDHEDANSNCCAFGGLTLVCAR